MKHNEMMGKHRGNPNWDKSGPIVPIVVSPTSFERAVDEFKLSPDQLIRSVQLREWARINKNLKYIPEVLLEAWGFDVEPNL
jgi:hypothetical protein